MVAMGWATPGNVGTGGNPIFYFALEMVPTVSYFV